MEQHENSCIMKVEGSGAMNRIMTRTALLQKRFNN